MIELTDIERDMLNRWQRDFPLTARPFARLGEELGMSEQQVLAALRRLDAAGVLSRLGAVVRPNTAGASTLAAVSAPRERVEEVARIISAQPEVTHNYQREHEVNLWFVVTAANRGAVRAVLARIEGLCGLDVLDLPMERAWHIDLGFDLKSPASRARPCRPRPHGGAPEPSAPLPGGFDLALLAAIEDGLPLVPAPYDAVARQLGTTPRRVMARLEALIEAGVIRRFGFVVHHRALGYAANAMVVWDFDETVLAAAAAEIARMDCVTLCYQRPRRLPRWRYNLFSMIHGTSRDVVLAQIAQIEARLKERLELDEIVREALFPVRRFKQCGARFSAAARAGAA